MDVRTSEYGIEVKSKKVQSNIKDKNIDIFKKTRPISALSCCKVFRRIFYIFRSARYELLNEIFFISIFGNILKEIFIAHFLSCEISPSPQNNMSKMKNEGFWENINWAFAQFYKGFNLGLFEKKKYETIFAC